MRHRTRGVTLVELSVIISAAAFQVAVLVPSSDNARQSARRAACAANLRQLIQGIQLHSEQNDDKIIWEDRDAIESGMYIHLINDVIPHDKNYWPVRLIEQRLVDSDAALSVVHCPADVGFTINSYPLNISYGVNNGTGYGTSYNCVFSGRHAESSIGGLWPRMSQIPSPAEFAAVADSGLHFFDPMGGHLSYRIVNSHGSHYGYRHNYGCNIAFFDGHLQSFSYPDAMYNYYGQNLADLNPQYGDGLNDQLVDEDDVDMLERSRVSHY